MAVAALALGSLLTGCSDDEPELTVEQRLEAVEGRTLSPNEVDQLLSLADDLCRLDEVVLDNLWTKLDGDQFDYQDFVFGYQCPERSTLYALHTGRVVTDEAAEATEGSILPTSTVPTTLPTTVPTTESTGRPAAPSRTPTTTAPATGGSAGELSTSEPSTSEPSTAQTVASEPTTGPTSSRPADDPAMVAPSGSARSGTTATTTATDR